MFIESLRLKGFKSFGSSCDFTFARGFTAIVGPNGSGKSNILDALRWILGEGGNIALRISKQSDLLFAGSISVPPATEAEVSLAISGVSSSVASTSLNSEDVTLAKAKTEGETESSGAENLAPSQARPTGRLLKRQYTNENGSVILLDGERMKVRDLDDIKAQLSLEGQGFAFIGQGDVANTIHQPPMERRRQLEFLFGIDRYRKRRDRTLARLDEALAEGQRIQTLIQELTARRTEIAPEVTIAVEAQGILDNLDILRRDFYFSRRRTLELDAARLRSDRQLTGARLESTIRWQNLWHQAVTLAEEGLKSQGFDEDKFLTRDRELSSSLDTLHKQGFQAATRVRAILTERVSMQQEQENSASREQELSGELERLQTTEKQQSDDLKNCKDTLDARVRELEASRANLEQERARRQKLRDELAERELFISRSESEIKAIAMSQSQSQSEIAKFENEIRQRQEAGHSLKEQLEKLEQEHAALSKEHTAVYADCQKAATSVQQLRRERARAEADLDSLKDSAGGSIYPEPVRLLLSASKLGRMKSHPEVAAEVFSCLNLTSLTGGTKTRKSGADLGLKLGDVLSLSNSIEQDNKNKVDSLESSINISPALEAFLGARQFWLLVHTMDEAQEGIDLLKQRRAGRVTYLPLERCRPRTPDYNFKLDMGSGIVGWVMDLIRVREPWEPAIAHMMGDLLIVRDYGLGSSIARRGARFPIVTLEGEVFSPAGTVSGGQGKNSQRGSAIALNRQISLIQKRIDEIQVQLSEQEHVLMTSEKREQKLAAALDEAAGKLEQARSDESANNRALATLANSIARLKSERATVENRVSKLEKSLSDAKTRITELEGELASLPALSGANSDSGLTEETILSPLKSELSLAEERLRGTQVLLARVKHEHVALIEKAASLSRDIDAGITEESNLRSRLGEIGRECLTLHTSLLDLRHQLASERARVQRSHARLQKLRLRSTRSDETASARRAEIATQEERLRSLDSEKNQLISLWEEKFPYDINEARELVRDIARDSKNSNRDNGRSLVSELRKLERELKALGPYNLGALSEDTSLTERIDFLTDQLEDVRGGVEELRVMIRETDEQVEASFTKAMAQIDARFNTLFQRLFGGGEARLTLQEGTDIWDRGVEIYARPPGKKLQNITQLSGGEQALTALAQLFSALEVAHAPLAVLDEVDAALDEYNLIRFADLAKEYSQSLQILVMTHRRTTMERADIIYGVTMVEPGLSRIVGIDPDDYR